MQRRRRSRAPPGSDNAASTRARSLAPPANRKPRVPSAEARLCAKIRVAQLESEIGADFEVGASGHERPRSSLQTFGPDARVTRLGDPHRPQGVPSCDRRPLGRVGFHPAEFTQRLEEMEPIGHGPRRDDHRAVDQRREEVRDARRVNAVARTHLLHRLEAERRRKHGEAAEERLLRLAEQLVAPADDALERALPFGDHLGPAAEQRKAIGEALRDLAGRERPEPGCRELEPERQTVEPRAHLRDRAERRLVQLERPGDELRTLQKEPHGGGLRELVEAGVLGRQAQRRNLDDGLARDAEWLAAGREEPYPRARRQERSRKLADGSGEVLTVVENEHELTPLEVVLQEADR